jgi:hypothetical protein
MLFFGNKYVKGITQFIPDNHFGPRDFIDYHREKMGLTREEYMAFYRTPVDYRLAESTVNEGKFPGRKGEFIKWKGEYFDIKKTAGSTAYVKFPHTASSAFSQVWDDEVTLADEKHRGKKVWLMESVVNEKAEGDRGPIDDEKIETALKNKVEETGVPIEFLRIVMRRGMAAWKTGHRPGATEQQWGYARVNSFLTKQPGTWGDADSDVAKEVRDGGHDKNLKKA